MEADLRQRQRDRIAHIGEVILRGDREVPALERGLVAEVAAALLGAGAPGGLDRVDLEEAVARVVLVLDRVEQVELRLGAEEHGVGDAGRLEIRLGLRSDLTRVAGERLIGERVDDRVGDDHRLGHPERIDIGARDIGDELHVRFVDRGEPADRRTVEQQTLLQLLLAVGRGREVEVLHHTGKVTEPDVDEVDVVFLHVGD